MLRIIVAFLILSCGLSTTNGFTIREASEGDSINSTIDVFKSIINDTNFTSIQLDANKTESANVTDDKIPIKVTMDKEEDKPLIVEEPVKPSPSSSNTPTQPPTSTSTTTTTTTTTPKPLNSSSLTTVNKPMVISMNDTDVSFGSNDTRTKEMFSSLDLILNELDGTNNTNNNNLDNYSSGGISSLPNDEFSNSPEINIRSTRVRAISEPKRLEVDTEDTYKPPIDALRGEVIMVTSISINDDKVTKQMEVKTVTEPSREDEKLEIVVDEPRTAETEKHWSKFSKATGYKIIWASDKNQNEREANVDEIEKKMVDHHEDGHVNEDGDGDSCHTIDKTDYFVDEINDLVKVELSSNRSRSNQKVIKTLRCGIMGLSKILESQDAEIDDWTDESILPLKEINRLERKIEDQQNFKCNCSIPLVSDVLHSIYIDPFLHEKRTALYKNHDWSSIIGDLRSSHVKIKHLYYQLHRNHIHIENLFNISIAMSHRLYEWRSKQMDIVINNSRRVRKNPHRHYNRG